MEQQALSQDLSSYVVKNLSDKANELVGLIMTNDGATGPKAGDRARQLGDGARASLAPAMATDLWSREQTVTHTHVTLVLI